MSKSDASQQGTILVSDSASEIWEKFKKAKSDSIAEIFYDQEKRPEISNLLQIYAAVKNLTIQQATSHFAGCRDTLEFKKAVSDAVIEKIVPIGQKREHVLKSGEVDRVLEEGNQLANEIAKSTLDEVKSVIGFK